MTSTSILSALDALRPHPVDARVCLRHSAFGILAVFLLVHLSPMPGPWRALDVVWLSRKRAETRQRQITYDAYGRMNRAWTEPPEAQVGTGEWCVCAAELALLGLLLLNVVQSILALKYPRKATRPLPSPAAKGIQFLNRPSSASAGPSGLAQSTNSKRKLLSPSTSPQPQRSFSSSYATSPGSPNPFQTSTSSTTLSPWKSPLSSSLNASLLSSTGTPSPSPAPYRGAGSLNVSALGRRPGSVGGRALEGSFLHRLRTADDSDDSDDDGNE
ncbi:hypothetical protein PUNSTDRAFT_145591 [Punctularia strigosozonata HHB-11173 SS5]|uniref:uncharacterized protein n=1 Tax=Punctularia strigosozonata (strain HHB-11173) TaxID=741275 RepID=UPI0004417D1B|nr:uncharacterized protein PUNSTDRAFT_145591 [Punctularia strigosozonata HHB-11173 SS5]EIN06325.1 hypothetical protein PUNSTDRAFT_145591 [Punctularia strigosozonata HHB-11173 SS5]